MGRQEKEVRYKELEHGIAHSFLLDGSALGRVGSMDGKRLVELFAERRRLVSCFSFLCEESQPVMETEKAREIVREIHQEEVVDGNHRDDYYRELEILGIPRAVAGAWKFSKTTEKVWRRMMNLVRRYVPRTELERLLMLRFSGEYLPGIEFSEIYNRLASLEFFTKHTSVFLYPHIIYDTTPHNGKPSHADRYVDLLMDQLESAQSWRTAEKVLTRAVTIRQQFYSQY